ncbi:MAG: hypothetical protein HY710_00760 [Candidatus Latescibacteria bacterium]|nr:hypothetical protein [Candidatus Latescibacterota bacterium]
MVKIVYSDKLGRTIRQDDLSTLGLSSQTLTEEALRSGRYENAIELVTYFHQEMRIMHGILMTWIKDLFRQMLTRGQFQGDIPATVMAIARAFETVPLGVAPREQTIQAIRVGDVEAAVDWLDRMRLEFKNPHEILVPWVHDLLTNLAETYGEEEVLHSITETVDQIWGPRYATWDQMTPEEKLQLTVEGMRGGHFSGPQRRGDVQLADEGDRYRIAFDPCGSGGVMRRGDPETGRAPYPTTGLNTHPHLWTWQKTGVHWYCTHCCITMEFLPGRRRGHPMRPLDHTLDHSAPCVWYIYKDETQTREYHYPRTGLERKSVTSDEWPVRSLLWSNGLD